MIKKKMILLGSLNILDFFLTQYILINGGSEANPFLVKYTSFWKMGIIKLIIIPLLLWFVYINKDKCGKLIKYLIRIDLLAYLMLFGYYIFGFSIGGFY